MAAPNKKDSSSQREISFRANEIGFILSSIKAGDCCSVVGVGSVGKSNLLRHLLRPETQVYHLGDHAASLKMILVDPNNMLDSLPLLVGSGIRPGEDARSSWAGYEIMTHRLYKAFYPLDGLSEEEQKEFTYAYRMLRDGQNPLLPHIGLRYLEHALDLFLVSSSTNSPQRKITFVFDEFEDLLERLPVRFFQTLRGLRDDYKYRLTYVVLTRRTLPQLIAEKNLGRLGFEPFVELFTDNTLYLGPYIEADARAMLEKLAERKEIVYPPSFKAFLLRVSGGHAGLLRASFGLAGQIAFGTPESEALKFLVNSAPIKEECQTIWDSLSTGERVALKETASNPRAAGTNLQVIALLQAKQLLKSEEGATEVNPVLFREYVRRFALLEDTSASA